MFPSTYFGLFPAFPHDDRGFAAMSFDPKFDRRWTSVIKPAIESARVGETSLKAHRVDLRDAGDSILTEILGEITRCRVFLADITVIGAIDGRPVRSANVMYEVGLAHAVRLPEEVVLFRSDKEELNFDVANVRVHTYDPDGAPEAAIEIVKTKIENSHGELELRSLLAVRRAVASLDLPSFMLLVEAANTGPIRHPPGRTVGDAIGRIDRTRSISRLLDIGALRVEPAKVTPELMARPAEDLSGVWQYAVTPFGVAITDSAARDLGLDAPEVRRAIDAEVASAKPPTSTPK